MTPDNMGKTAAEKNARARGVLRPLAPEMSLAEGILVGCDAHHPTAPLAEINGAEGARKPPKVTLPSAEAGLAPSAGGFLEAAQRRLL